jgi:glutamyl-tRNA reductase
MEVNSEVNSFEVFGIHHQNANIAIREQFSLNEDVIKSVLEKADSDASVIILSTCNRTEIWSHKANYESLKDNFLTHVKGDPEEFEKLKFHKKGKDAIQHIFEVSAGIDSQILGDLQIQSQIKKAVKFSEESNSLSSELNRLIQIALRYSKRIKNETSISEGAASVAYAAVQYILEKSKDLKSNRILLFGTGKIGSVTCENLRKHIAQKNLVLTNRTIENADRLAKKIGAQVKPIEQLDEELQEADIIIVATGSTSYTINENHQNSLQGKKRILIDLSVPRNVDPILSENPLIEMADVDLLSKMQSEAIGKRKQAIPEALLIIEEAKEEFFNWINIRHLSPTFEAIKNKLDSFRIEELEYHKNKFTQEEIEKIDGVTSRLMNKLARQMINHLKVNHLAQNDPVNTLNAILEIKN